MPDTGHTASHSIRIAARLSGLSAHVIRIWEKRYAVVKPHRTGTNRRVYSDEDVTRLRLLRDLTAAGHNIGNIASLPDARLRELLEQSQTSGNGKSGEPRNADLLEWNSHSALPPALPTNGRHHPEVTETSHELSPHLDAIQRLDTAGLDQSLTQSLLKHGMQGFLVRVAGPLAHQVGESWRAGEFTAAHEHFATASLKVFLGAHQRSFALAPAAPVIVVATPCGQLHELGAVIAGAAAANAGWRVSYLGANLPAAELAGAAIRNGAKAVALSIVYPCDDPHLPEELHQLRQALPPQVEIIAGGRASHHYGEALQKIRAHRLSDLPGFFDWLNLVRTQNR